MNREPAGSGVNPAEVARLVELARKLPSWTADDSAEAVRLYEECERVLGLASIEKLALYRCSGEQWIVFGGLVGLRARIIERLRAE